MSLSPRKLAKPKASPDIPYKQLHRCKNEPSGMLPLLDKLLLPPALGHEPWKHPHFRRFARTLDTGCLMLVVMNNLLLMLILPRRGPTLGPVIHLALPLAFICGALLQLYVSHRRPAVYCRYRHYIMLGNRIIRLMAPAIIIATSRSWLASPTIAHPVAAFVSSQPLPHRPLLAALSALLSASGAFFSLVNHGGVQSCSAALHLPYPG